MDRQPHVQTQRNGDVLSVTLPDRVVNRSRWLYEIAASVSGALFILLISPASDHAGTGKPDQSDYVLPSVLAGILIGLFLLAWLRRRSIVRRLIESQSSPQDQATVRLCLAWLGRNLEWPSPGTPGWKSSFDAWMKVYSSGGHPKLIAINSDDIISPLTQGPAPTADSLTANTAAISSTVLAFADAKHLQVEGDLFDCDQSVIMLWQKRTLTRPQPRTRLSVAGRVGDIHGSSRHAVSLPAEIVNHGSLTSLLQRWLGRPAPLS